MTEPALWTDRAFLRDVQYKTDANLAARQSIYAYQQPPVDLVGQVLDLAGPAGREVVADVGCGNGLYLAELTRREYRGPVLGVDLSPGMLRVAGHRAPRASVLVADATALPLRDASADLALAMHMLYHVPEPERVVRELRRITRPGGRVVVGLNGVDHLGELRDLITAALGGLDQPGMPPTYEKLTLERGEMLLRSSFGSVVRYDFVSSLRLPGPEPVAGYVRSLSEVARQPDPGPLVDAVVSRMPETVFEVTTHSGCLVCT